MKRRNFFLTFCLALTLLLLAMQSVTATENDRTQHYKNFDHSHDEIIAEAMRNRENEFIDDKYGFNTMGEFQEGTAYVYFTNSDIIGIKDISTFYRYNDGQIISMKVNYVEDFDAYQKSLQLIRAEVDALMPENPTQLEIVHILHDYLIATSEYDMAAGKGIVPDYSVFYASGVYKNHSAVCRGISHAYKYLLDCYGIDNAIAESTQYNHVWNLVRLNGEWYHVDLTADESGYDVLGQVSHDYFLISTDTLLEKCPQKSDFTVLYKNLNLVFTDDTCAGDKTYETGQFWSDSHSVCHCYNDNWYTVRSDNVLWRTSRSEPSKEASYYQPDEHMQWHPNGNEGACYTNAIVTPKITAIGKDLYLNSPRNIYHVDLDTGEGEIVYSPEDTKLVYDEFLGCEYNPKQIFGLNRSEGKMYISIEEDIPNSAPEWIYIPGFDVTYDIKEPETPSGLVDPQDAQLKNTINITSDMDKETIVRFSGLQTGETLQVKSGNESIAKATVSGSKITIKTGIDGSTSIQVIKMSDTSVKGNYTINLTVNKNYKDTKEFTLMAGESTSCTDQSGDYSKAVNTSLLDEKIATLKVTGVNTPGTPGTAGGFTKMTSFSSGSFVIGYESGSTKYYLKANGTTLSAITDKNNATAFNFSGSESGFTIKSGNYYLTHGSKLALSSSSSNATWSFDNGKIYYSKASLTRTYKYYLRYSNKNFTVSNSTSALAGMFSNQEATPEIPGEVYTKVDITGVSSGQTYAIIGETLYKINVKGPVVTQVITVHIVDDQGVKIADDYTISGEEGTNYNIQPTFRYGYLAPRSIFGTFTAEPTGEVSLMYTLNTDKSELKQALDNPVLGDLYSDQSYSVYQNALDAGSIIYNSERVTQDEVDQALTAINDAKNALSKKNYTVTINYVDNFGNTLADTRTITGEIDSSYSIKPEAISGYLAPEAIEGTFVENTTLTFCYTLNTDKTQLENELNNMIAKGEYTDESYALYTLAIENGKTVNNNVQATQSQVDTAVKTITDAKSSLKVMTKVSYVQDIDGINSGSEYIITYNGKALAVSDGKLTYIDVNASDEGVSSVDDAAIWVITKYSSSSYYLKNKATGQYLTTSTGGSIFSRTYSLSLTTSKTTWTASKNSNYMRFSKSSRYLTYSNGFGLTTSKSSNTNMTLYVKK